MDFLTLHVEQVQVEVHFRGLEQNVKLAKAFTDAGFRIFSKEPNIMYSDGSCVEFSMWRVRRRGWRALACLLALNPKPAIGT